MGRGACALLLAALLGVACSGTNAPQEAPQLAAQPPVQAKCFLQVTPGEPIVVDGDTLERPVDSLMIHMDLIGELVNGTYDFLPQETDPVQGSFTGTLENGLVTALFTYTTEGTTGKQEVLFRLEDGGLRIGNGEMTEAEGISVFKDKSKAAFGELVPESACP